MSQPMLQWLLPILLLQAIAGIVSVVRMWSRITLLEADGKVRDKEMLDMKVTSKATDANLTGLGAQMTTMSSTLGKITGQLEILLKDRHLT